MTSSATDALNASAGAPMPTLAARRSISPWIGIVLCAILATAQIGFGGYQLGVGNQSIQIAFLKHWNEPWMYASDDMVTQTMPGYPTYFFRLLAPLLSFMDVPTLYLVLQLVTSFATLASVYLLSRAMFKSHAGGLAAVGLLVGGHLGALAGEPLYYPGFTHTYAALPMAVIALALAFRGRWLPAFLIAGILFNLHALTAAYALLMLGAALLADAGERPITDWLSRAVMCGAAALAAASPTLAVMLQQHQTFDGGWVDLMRIRSADHSFPSAWWGSLDGDVPRFVLIAALYAVSWSFVPRESVEQRRVRRTAALMTAAVVALFAAGYVFTEMHPIPFVIRLQPFRASRLLLVLMLVQIAFAAVEALRAGWRGSFAPASDGKARPMPMPVRLLEVAAGITVLAVLAIPSLLLLLPYALVVAIAAAFVAGHLSWRQGIVASGALLVVVLAFIQIRFPVPWLSAGVGILPHDTPFAGGRALALAAVSAAAVAAFLLMWRQGRAYRAIVAAMSAGAAMAFGMILFHQQMSLGAGGDFAKLAPVSQWARTHTAPDAVFLTPTGLDDFRITSERAIVTSWRDGTQLYFSANYGPEWIERMSWLEPGFQLTQDGRRLLTRGNATSLADLDDGTLMDCARDYGADYIVLPTVKGRSRALVVAERTDDYTVYEPRVDVGTIPTGVRDPLAWNRAETFMATTVQDNIEKYRKTNVTVEVVDAAGKPVGNLPIRLDQTKQAFVFGVSLGFFKPNSIPAQDDEKPAPVRPVELQLMPELFNGSMIPFSGKWQYLEWNKGKPDYSDLDQYVDYCTSHGITMEFHHLAGTLPAWVEQMGGVGGQVGLSFSAPRATVQAEFDRHCLDVVGRYAGRIRYFQVENEKYMMQYVPEIFKKLKEQFPQTQFGVSDCVRFWDGGASLHDLDTPVNTQTVQFKGADTIDWLAQRGIKPDFFSMHGHHPDGLWADPEEMYRAINFFANKDVRVHISEMYLDLSNSVTGPIRSGIPWTADLQAEYLCRYLTVCFSHPDVDMVNFWGLPTSSGWGYSQGGLIDGAGKPRPAWDALKKLFTQDWRTHVAGILAPDGSYMARTFQGTFNVTVTLPGGKTATAEVVVPSEKPEARIRLQLDAATGKLDVAH